MKGRTFVVEVSMRKDQENLGRWRIKIGMSSLERRIEACGKFIWMVDPLGGSKLLGGYKCNRLIQVSVGTERIAECTCHDHATEKMIQKNAGVFVCATNTC